MTRVNLVGTIAASIGIGLALIMSGALVAPPAAALDVYTTPGTHEVNGRTWRTECSDYSSSVRRCRTDIIATTVVASSGGFTSKKGWTFNNLTYLPSARGQWTGNPLATPGDHTIDGRQWRTECDTPATGRNGCRSYIRARVVDVVSTNPTRHGWTSKWIFNNIVKFTSVPVPDVPIPLTCKGAPHPVGYNVGSDGMPSQPAGGQHPANAFDPHYIGNYIRNVLRDSRTSDSQKRCLATVAGTHLIKHSTTRIIDGVTSRWFPFEYDFRANPSVPTLRAPWYSGLAQANALTLSILMEDVTGDPAWARYGRETFESFLVPSTDGGFASREKGFLWFEHYPTAPGTTVLNAHFQALIGLSYWGMNMAEPRATALVDESRAELDLLLTASEVEVEAGVMASYGLLRGYDAAPLRLVGSPNFRWDQARLNGAPQGVTTVPRTTRTAHNHLLNSDMTAVSNGLPEHWRALGARSQVSATGATAKIVTDGKAWQGLAQRVPPGTFTAGEPLHLGLRSRLTLPEGRPGTSGKVMAYEECSGRYRVLHTTAKFRSATWASYDLGFKAPRDGCSLEIRLLSAEQGPANTVVEFDDVVLSRADVVGSATTPQYDLRVDRTPVNILTFTGTGSAMLQAHADGRWQDIGDITLSVGVPASIPVPERFTGRNLHYGYHEGHVSELMQLHRLTGDPMFLRYARRWAPLAPLFNGTVPPGDARALSTVDAIGLPVAEILSDPAAGDALEGLEKID